MSSSTSGWDALFPRVSNELHAVHAEQLCRPTAGHFPLQIEVENDQLASRLFRGSLELLEEVHEVLIKFDAGGSDGCSDERFYIPGRARRRCSTRRSIRSQSRSAKESDAIQLLKIREGDIAHGLRVNPKLNRIRFDEAPEDLKTEYAVNAHDPLSPAAADPAGRRVRPRHPLADPEI